jgi:energy-coupling factor transport system substrate-specific component
LVAAVVSAPIAAYVFGGVTGGGTDLVVGLFRAMGANIWQAVLGQGIVSDPLDKALTFVLAWSVVQAMPRRQLARFPGGAQLAPAADDAMDPSDATRAAGGG